MPKILALDVANVTGWAIAEDQQVLASGAIELVSGEIKSDLRNMPGSELSRLATLSLYVFMINALNKWRPDAVVAERPFWNHRSPMAGAQLFTLRGVVLLVSILRKLPFYEVEARVWQAWASRCTDWSKTKVKGVGDKLDAEALGLWASVMLDPVFLKVANSGRG